MRSSITIFSILFAIISLTKASLLVFEFYDTVDPVHRQVERFCINMKNTGRNLCRLLRQYDGPCKDAIDKQNCIYDQCNSSSMSGMPICRKIKSLVNVSERSLGDISVRSLPAKRRKRRKMPLLLTIFNVQNSSSQVNKEKIV